MLSLGAASPFWVNWQQRAAWADPAAALHILDGQIALGMQKVNEADPRISFDRASAGWAYDADGRLIKFDAGEIRATNAGHYTAPQIEQFFPSPDMAGAMVGVVGSGGALPDGWEVANASDIVIHELTNIDGMPIIDLSMAVDNSAGGASLTASIRMLWGDLVSAQSDEIWTFSAWAEIIEADYDVQRLVNEHDGAQAYLRSNNAAALTGGRESYSFQIGADAVYIHPYLLTYSVPAGEISTLRIRLAVPNLTKTAYLAQPILEQAIMAADNLCFDISAFDLSAGFWGVWRGEVFGSAGQYPRLVGVSNADHSRSIALGLSQYSDGFQLYQYEDETLDGYVEVVSDPFGLHDIVFGFGPDFSQVIVDGVASVIENDVAFVGDALTMLVLGSGTTSDPRLAMRTDEFKLFPGQPGEALLAGEITR